MAKFIEYLVEMITKLGGLFTGLIASTVNSLIRMAFPNVDVSGSTNYTTDMKDSYFVKTFVGMAMVFTVILCYLLGGAVSKMFKKSKKRKSSRRKSSYKTSRKRTKRRYKRRK